MVDNIRVRNFKSLRDSKMEGCRRVNLLVGRPNVGKSNLLEALALFSTPYLRIDKQSSIQMLVRAEHSTELFFDGNTSNPIEVMLNNNCCVILDRNTNGELLLRIMKDDKLMGEYKFSNSLMLDHVSTGDGRELGLVSYRYVADAVHSSYGVSQLLPPSGANLMEVVKQLPVLKDEANRLMESYGLKLVFDNASQELKAMKEQSGEIFLIPFTSMADSLQRLLFNKAAILSNHRKVICLEEPETHTFPPYIASVVQEIIDSDDNQFFISTQSPYVVNALMEALSDDLAIFFVTMTDGETAIKRASDEDIQEMYDNGVDLFFNLETYL